jgi:hypothetical protein
MATASSTFPGAADEKPLEPDQTSRPTGEPGEPGGEDLFARVVKGAHETIDRLAETAAPHVRDLQGSVASAKEMFQARGSEACDIGAEWADSLRATVREHPLAALATAIALGVLVARLAR